MGMKRPTEEADPAGGSGQLDNSQSTHYSIAWPKRRKNAVNELASTPFRQLLGETVDVTKHRYSLYEHVWGHQLAAIERILNSANNKLFADLLRYITAEVSPKLDTALLGLSSNIANNLRILDEFSAHVSAQDTTHVRMVRLNSKVCFNIKVAIREMVKQVLEGPAPKEEEYEDDEEKVVNEEDDFVESEDDEAEGKVDGDGGRISYDFEIVEEWVDSYRKRTKCGDRLRLIVVLDDSDGFSNEVLNQLVQLFCVYSNRTPIKLILGLSSKNASEWVNSKLTSKLRTLIQSVRLEAKDNRDIGYQVIDDILLQHEITADNPLLLDAQLSLIVLNRFENSNNSIDSLITELKLSYMIYFYQLPLAVLVDPDFEPQPFHHDALRKLPLFKTHIEYLLHQYSELGDDSQKQHIIELLQDNRKLHSLFLEAKTTFQKYQNSVMNAINIVHYLCMHQKQKFQIYKLVTNNQLINSLFLSDSLKRIRNYDSAQIQALRTFLMGDLVKTVLKNCVDEDAINLQQKAGALDADLEDSGKNLLTYITDYLHTNKYLNMKISDNLFNEVLTITGGSDELDLLRPSVSIEENYQNLMINLIRPNQREMLEVGMDEPQFYLKNPLVVQGAGIEASFRLLGPVLCKMYQIYKDAPVNINLWDYFVAFKQTLVKGEIIKEIKLADGVDKALVERVEASEEAWERMVYAWFVQSCFELNFMGFIRDKSKGDYVEKMIWKNL